MISLRALAYAVALTGLTVPALADKALVIGIDSYSDPKLVLVGTSSIKDADSIVAMLKLGLGYADADIKVLTNEAATRAAILENFKTWLIDGTKPGDRAFFYYSGQGYFEADANGDEKDGLDETLVPFDAVVNPGDEPTISATISDDELILLLKQLEGRKVTVAVDAGHSGLVTKGQPVKKPTLDGSIRVADLGTNTRSIVVEPKAKAQKAEGAPLDTEGLSADVAVFTATSGGQAALIEGGEGAFTKAFVEALQEKGADANANGIVSNAEVLAFLRDKSETACAANEGCDLGLTPTLGPDGAAGGSPHGDDKNGPLTADSVLDYFAKGNAAGVTLEQFPPSPVPVGTRDIRFRVTSPAEGNLVLLDLSDDGTLTQLFPNEHLQGGGREGYILAGSPITVPDDYYGIKFNATSPTKGTLIALVTTEPIELPETVKTRKIEVIPREEATEVFLPAIAAALEKPADTAADTATRDIEWSVATLRYEIVKH